MYRLRPAKQRGITRNDWLKSEHSFTFNRYFDPFNMGFSDLRAINDNKLAPSAGQENQFQADMEIITIILNGTLEYKGGNGTTKFLTPKHIHTVSTGTGITYSEFNPSVKNSTHFLQIWILPNKKNFPPSSQTKTVTKEQLLNRIKLIVSGSGKNNSAKIHQDTEIYQSILEIDKTVFFSIPENRKLWLQVLTGAVEVNSTIMEAGDGMSVTGETGELKISSVDIESNFIIINLRNLTI